MRGSDIAVRLSTLAASEAPLTGRIREIDGLRALAVAGVVAYHFGLGPSGGFLGVDLFFVISGYVITRSLLVERAMSGRTSLSRFWARRVTRIFPSLAVVLLAVGIWAHLGGSDAFVRAAGQQSLAAVVSGVNWWQIFGPTGYWDLGAQESPLTHLWSLAVEEQFYLVWPLLLAIISMWPGGQRWTVVAVLALASYLWAGALADPIAIEQDYGILNRLYEGTDTRAGAILLGCTAALAPRLPPSRRPLLQAARRVGIPLAFTCLLSAWAFAEITDPALYRGVLAATGLAAAAILYFAGSGSLGLVAPLLRCRPVAALGALSYVVYLWHWPVWVWSGTTPLADQPWPRGAVALSITICLAYVTHRLVERPLLRRGLGWSTAIPVVLVVSAIIALNAVMLLETTTDQAAGDSVGARLPYIPA